MALPLSKSMSNRALMIGALTPGGVKPARVADCDDTRAMEAGLERRDGEVNVGAAGTAMRFLAAYYASQPGVAVTLDGSERMRERPIGELVNALRSVGAEIEYGGEEGFPPLVIKGTELRGGDLEVDASVSSQFISALMMVGPTMEGGLRLTLKGRPVSRPYIAMTAAMMEAAGADVEFYNDTVEIAGSGYSRPTLDVELDWSAAAYAYEIQSLASGDFELPGLRAESCQGDSALAGIYRDLGVVTRENEEGVVLEADPDCSPRLIMDMTENPDIVPSLVVNLCMLGIPFRLSGLETLRVKESDRVEALRQEMAKLGLMLTIEDAGTLSWERERVPVAKMPRFATHDDHRLAMALAPVALYLPGIVIEDVEVVNKSFPDYWNQLGAMGFILSDGDAEAPTIEEEQ